MQRHVLRRKLRQFIGLRVHPPQGLHLLEVVVGRQLGGEVHRLGEGRGRSRGRGGGRGIRVIVTKEFDIPRFVETLRAQGPYHPSKSPEPVLT